MEKRILVPLAEGFETIEALAVVDVFRRAGVAVDLAAIGESLEVNSSHQVRVTADLLLSQCLERSYELIVLPGGIPGAANLQKSAVLLELLAKQRQAGKLYGAICAAPALVLEPQGLLAGKKATCHPGFTEHLSDRQAIGERVVVDGNCVTAKGAGVSVDFALELLERVAGVEARQVVAKGMVVA